MNQPEQNIFTIPEEYLTDENTLLKLNAYYVSLLAYVMQSSRDYDWRVDAGSEDPEEVIVRVMRHVEKIQAIAPQIYPVIESDLALIKQFVAQERYGEAKKYLFKISDWLNPWFLK